MLQVFFMRWGKKSPYVNEMSLLLRQSDNPIEDPEYEQPYKIKNNFFFKYLKICVTKIKKSEIVCTCQFCVER